MKYFFDNENWSDILFVIAKKCRSSYMKAILYRAIKFILGLSSCVMFIIAFIKKLQMSNTYYIIAIVLLIAYYVMDSLQTSNNNISFDEQNSNNMFKLKDALADIIKIPDALKKCNPTLTTDSYAIVKLATGGCVLMFKACMQQFPIYVLSDKICNRIIDKELSDVDYSLQLDLNANELNLIDVIIRFYATEQQATKAAKDTMNQVRESVKGKREFVEFCNIIVIDRDIPNEMPN